VSKTSQGVGPERRHDQPGWGRGFRERGRHGGVTAPSTRDPPAPVAAGTLPGCP
jgi:hypothetical protein